MDSFDLVRLHMGLECIGLDDAGQLVRIPGPTPDTLHRVYVARYDQGDRLFYRSDLPNTIRARLARLRIAEFFDSPERVAAILEEDAPCQEIHIGKSYIFPQAFPPARYPDVVRLSEVDLALVKRYDPDMDPDGHDIYGVLIDGMIVSTCESSRENDQAGEAWVRTLDGFRRRGYARQATAAWGTALLAQGKTPFYSHRIDDLASQGLAQSLGLIQYLEDAGYA